MASALEGSAGRGRSWPCVEGTVLQNEGNAIHEPAEHPILWLRLSSQLARVLVQLSALWASLRGGVGRSHTGDYELVLEASFWRIPLVVSLRLPRGGLVGWGMPCSSRPI